MLLVHYIVRPIGAVPCRTSVRAFGVCSLFVALVIHERRFVVLVSCFVLLHCSGYRYYMCGDMFEHGN